MQHRELLARASELHDRDGRRAVLALLSELILKPQVDGPLVTDAAPAALALQQGVILCSTDQDFRRFRGLESLDPLVQALLALR